MAKCKNYLLNIEKFYKFQAIDHIMFGYVQGMRRALPGMHIADAIQQFLKSFGIEEDVYCYDTAKTTYYRILSSIVEMSKKNDKVDENVIF